MWWICYRILLWIAYPVVRLRLRLRARRDPAYGERVAERFGRVPPTVAAAISAAETAPIWVHSVSAGETIAAAPLIHKIAAGSPVLVTTMTPTGSDQVNRLLVPPCLHCYAPYDFEFAVRRFLATVKPRALVLVETEIWPNLIRLSAARNIPVVIVNARLSARSARGYARAAGFTRELLRQIDWIAAQYPHDAERFVALGAQQQRVQALGNVKFDLAALSASADERASVEVLAGSTQLATRPSWLAGSTHADEEVVLLAAHRELLTRLPDACLVLVPRHPDRFDEVAQLAADFRTVRASDLLNNDLQLSEPVCEVLLVDAMGLLRTLYGACDVAFVGGSLVPVGGHNPIEAAALGVPVLMGPERHNFAGVCELFDAAGCLIEVEDARSLAQRLEALLQDATERDRLGALARESVAANRGATDRVFAGLAGILDGARPR